MLSQTLTLAIESESEPEMFFEFLSEAGNIPKWAPIFADTIECIGDSHYRVRKDGESFEMNVLTNKTAGTVDYIREMSGGKRGGAYIRVVPRPLGGSCVCMTVPVAANTSRSEVARVLEQELAELVRFVCG